MRSSIGEGADKETSKELQGEGKAWLRQSGDFYDCRAKVSEIAGGGNDSVLQKDPDCWKKETSRRDWAHSKSARMSRRLIVTLSSPERSKK